MTRRWALIIPGVALVMVVTLARAQQIGMELGEGDEVTVTCPTALSIAFDDAGGATVSCAAESAESAAEDGATEDLPPAP